MSSNILLNKNKRIGKVLFIVEGEDDEIRILHKIFTKIFDYKYEKLDRSAKYYKYEPKDKTENSTSSIFVINTEESNIKFVEDANGYLDNLFVKLINEYKFPVDKAAIYYIFDRDHKSNTDKKLIEELIYKLRNSREPNEEFDNQGLLLLSYPAIESFTTSNYSKDTFNIEFETGDQVKKFLHENNYTNQRINLETMKHAVCEMNNALKTIGIDEYDFDNFYDTNMKVYNYEEEHFKIHKKYKLLSLLCIALMDLGLIEIEFI